MRYFNCAKCSTRYALDTEKKRVGEFIIGCQKCGAKNKIRVIPVLQVSENGSNSQKKLGLLPGKNTVGREGNLAVSDPGNLISRRHAIVHVEKHSGKWFFFIEDLNSTNGTFTSSGKRLEPGKKYPFPIDNAYYNLAGNVHLTIILDFV